jgi:hypothetical protein
VKAEPAFKIGQRVKVLVCPGYWYCRHGIITRKAKKSACVIPCPAHLERPYTSRGWKGAERDFEATFSHWTFGAHATARRKALGLASWGFRVPYVDIVPESEAKL